MKRISELNLFLWLLGAGCMAHGASPTQPVYIYLHSRISDHVNIELSEARLRHVLPLLDRYRKEHPESHISATILFSGAMSQALSNRNAENGIKDFVLDYISRGVIEAGYDGTDEPTYRLRPLPDLTKAKTAQERWLARGDAAERFLTESRHPLFGIPQPGIGGLKQMQAILGEAACITGVTPDLGSDPEVVQHLERYNTKAIMFGIPEINPAKIPGYGGSTVFFGNHMSPIPESPPELYWQDNVLRSSETGDRADRVVHGDEGANAIKDVIGRLDRSKIHVIHVELVSQRMYLHAGPTYPPLKLAYDDPGHNRLPRTALHDADDVNFAYTKEEGLIKWLIEDFFTSNPGSRFVSSTDLKRMTPPSVGFSVSVGGLRSALGDLLKAWGKDTLLPNYIRVDGRYLSLADSFLVMTEALAELNNTKELPQSVRVSKVYGPIEMPDDHGPNLVEVTVASVARACAGLVGRLNDSTWEAVPKNAIPSRVAVAGAEVNSAQFLRLMAEALVSPSPETKLQAKMTYMYSTAAYTFPTTRRLEDEGGMWTIKPAPLDAGQALRTER